MSNVSLTQASKILHIHEFSKKTKPFTMQCPKTYCLSYCPNSAFTTLYLLEKKTTHIPYSTLKTYCMPNFTYEAHSSPYIYIKKNNLSNPFLTLASISYTVKLIHQFTSHIKKMLTNPLLQWLQNNCLLHYTNSEFTSLGI